MTRPGPDISPVDADALAATGHGALLLDVREDEEWEVGHAPGAAHVRLGDLDPAALSGARAVIAVCRSGHRSSRAAALLAAAGLQVHNMAGGMNAWAAAGLPVVRDDGSPGEIA